MVREQLTTPSRNITNARVLEAMSRVPRHEFVPPDLASKAYQDRPLQIGFGQTISQPYVVAFMTEVLDPQPGERVLEIGTGCGYQTAVLASLGAKVYSVEVVPELAAKASDTLFRLGYTNVHVRCGDGYRGWPEAGPFPRIIATCAPETMPAVLLEQLADGGRFIIPVGEKGVQELRLVCKHAGLLKEQGILPVRFVPMVPGGPELI